MSQMLLRTKFGDKLKTKKWVDFCALLALKAFYSINPVLTH